MKVRQARKILQHPARSKRLRRKLEKMYPSYTTESGLFRQPSWHEYYLFQKAWSIMHRKIRHYGDRFKLM